MQLEQQCVSLEIARKLKELNVKQESLFYWENCPDEGRFVISSNEYHDTISGEWGDCHCLMDQENYSAYSVAELFDMLPACVDIKKDEPFNNFWLYLQKRSTENIQYILNYRCDTYDPPNFFERFLCSPNVHDENLANALGKMMIYLIENNLMPKE